MRTAGTPALVALGSNVGRRRANLDGAIFALRATPGLAVEAVSPFVETDPVGGPPGQRPFLNGVARVRWSGSARALLERLAALERAFGRRRDVPRGPRTLDLDLLTFGSQRIDEPDLVVPHPRMEGRTFVLEPLARLESDLVLPGCGRTVARRLAELRAAESRSRAGSPGCGSA